MLKETLARMQIVQPDMLEDPSEDSEASPVVDEEDQEIMRLRYFEALRRQQFEEQMRHHAFNQHRQRTMSDAQQPFRTPNVMQFNYEDLYSYGSELNTASANYRPGNSNTLLRRKNKPPKSSLKKPANYRTQTTEKSALMDPADDSFHVSPIEENKYTGEKLPRK